MTDKEFSGKLVFLTVHVDKWLREINPNINVPMANRIAKVIKVFDWGSEEGKLLLDQRKKIGKWKTLDPRSFKFVLKIYHPDLIAKNNSGKEVLGFAAEEVLPRYYPSSKLTFFECVPDWMLRDFKKVEKEIFQIVDKKKELHKAALKKKPVVAKKKIVAKKKVKCT